jgi:hypothetical protein
MDSRSTSASVDVKSTDPEKSLHPGAQIPVYGTDSESPFEVRRTRHHTSPISRRVRTNHHAERANRMIRFLETVWYKWLRQRPLVRFVVLRLDHIGNQGEEGEITQGGPADGAASHHQATVSSSGLRPQVSSFQFSVKI